MVETIPHPLANGRSPLPAQSRRPLTVDYPGTNFTARQATLANMLRNGEDLRFHALSPYVRSVAWELYNKGLVIFAPVTGRLVLAEPALASEEFADGSLAVQGASGYWRVARSANQGTAQIGCQASEYVASRNRPTTATRPAAAARS